MLFSITLQTVETITTARKVKNRKRDNHLTDAAPVVKYRRTPVHETIIDAVDMTAARRIARAELTAAAPAYNLPLMSAVNIVTDAAPVDAALMVANKSLKNAYSKQCMRFMYDMIRSLDRAAARARSARRSISFDDLATLDQNAADVVSVASMAIIDARAAVAAHDVAAVAIMLNKPVDVARACVDAAPCYTIARAAYRATGEYIRAARNRAATTARQDIFSYLHAADDRADIDAATEFDNGYTFPADAAAAEIARAAYVHERHENRRVIRAAMDCMTPKQRRVISSYADTNSMRLTAARIGLKNQSTVARHIDAARRAIDNAAPVDVVAYEKADADARARSAAIVADTNNRAAVDVARAAIDATAATVDARRNRAAYDAATARRAAIDARRAAVDAIRAAVSDAADYSAIDAAVAAARAARARATVADVSAAALTAIDTIARKIDRAAVSDAAAARAKVDAARAAYDRAADRAKRLRVAHGRAVAAARAAVATDADNARALFDRAAELTATARRAIDAARAARAEYAAAVSAELTARAEFDKKERRAAYDAASEFFTDRAAIRAARK